MKLLLFCFLINNKNNVKQHKVLVAEHFVDSSVFFKICVSLRVYIESNVSGYKLVTHENNNIIFRLFVSIIFFLFSYFIKSRLLCI